jgi:uroporphyrinogen-III synthase
MHRKSVFITRERESILPFIKLLKEQEVEVVAQPLFSYRSLNFARPTEAAEWIFFSSRNAVKFFFEKEMAGPFKYAAIGPATGKELAKYVPVSFAGRDYDTQKTAHEFAAVAGTSKILFPCGADSLRSVQKVFPDSQVLDMVCYQSVKIPGNIGPHAAYVVLSPENARAIMDDTSINRLAVFFVLGEPTAKALIGRGISNIHYLPHGDSMGWARSLLTEI